MNKTNTGIKDSGVVTSRVFFGYWVIVVGLIMAFATAVVPFYNTSYQLLAGVLAAGVLPYLIYAIAVVLLQRTITLAAGVILFATHFGLMMQERVINNADYSNGMIYYVPIAVSLLLIPLAVAALRKPPESATQ